MNDRDKFLTIEALSSQIDDRVKRIQKGTMKIEMLERLLDEVKDLQERLIIIKYKAMEKLAKLPVEKNLFTAENSFNYRLTESTNELNFGLERKGNVPENQISLIDSIAEVEKQTIVVKKTEPKPKGQPKEQEKEKKSRMKKVSVENKTTLGQKINKSPISDISKAIKLNTRIGMIKQLFKGDAELFKRTIDNLNNAASLNEANKILDTTRKDNQLLEDNKWYIKLAQLVERKHI